MISKRRDDRVRRAPSLRSVIAAPAVAAAIGAVVTGGCSGADRAADSSEPAPLDTRDLDPPPASVHDPTPTPPASAAPTSATPGTSDRETTSLDGSARAAVDTVLGGYADALTSIAADPLVATLPGHPGRAAWDAVVDPTSAFSAEMLARRVEMARSDGVVVRPPSSGPGAVSYRHRALEVADPVLDTISFRWCGWSPGIGVDTDTGAIVDDAVAHAHGTGLVRRGADDRWRLERLDETELVLLDPGSVDPCPAEVDEHLGDAGDGGDGGS